jgi:4-hydroxybenzoate polyprenyltransferase
LRIASLVHAGATVFFFLTGWSLHLGVWYWLGLLVAVLLMYKQHSLMSAQNLLHLKFAFFHLNGILSITMLIAILVDIGAR